MEPMKATSELLTIDELSKKLKLHPTTTRGLYRRGIIPGVKIGHRTLRFDYQDVVASLKYHDDPAAPVDA